MILLFCVVLTNSYLCTKPKCKMMNDKRITVFTPTYNRRYMLPALYESLCEQDCKDFVWLVVDDGSNDDTGDQVAQWQNDGLIDIQYHYQTNAGKTAAHNKGVRLCQTELFVCIDSDDRLSSPSVIGDTIRFWDENSELASMATTSGIVSYRKMLTGDFSPFPENVKLSTLSYLYENGFKGETTLVFKTEVLKRFSFPEIEGERFITENYVYDQMDEHYKMLVFPYFSQDCEFRDDGITRNAWDFLFKNPKGYRMYYNQSITLKKGNPSWNMRMYIACSLIAKDGRLFSASDHKLMLLRMLPLGLYQYYKLLHRKW